MISNKLKELREKHKYTMKEVAEGIKISPDRYKNYEYGRREPNIDTLRKLAKFYKVSADVLLELSDNPNPVDQLPIEDDEKSVLEGYLTLPASVRAEILDVMIKLAQQALKARRGDNQNPPLFVLHRFSQHKASAGVGFDLYDPDIWQDLTVIDCPEAREADFAVQIEGDSMEDTLHDGDIVYVKIDPNVPIGKIGIFIIDGEGYVKERGTDRLISHNSEYDPIYLEGKESRCVGMVIGIAELPE